MLKHPAKSQESLMWAKHRTITPHILLTENNPSLLRLDTSEVQEIKNSLLGLDACLKLLHFLAIRGDYRDLKMKTKLQGRKRKKEKEESRQDSSLLIKQRHFIHVFALRDEAWSSCSWKEAILTYVSLDIQLLIPNNLSSSKGKRLELDSFIRTAGVQTRSSPPVYLDKTSQNN